LLQIILLHIFVTLFILDWQTKYYFSHHVTEMVVFVTMTA